MPLVQALKRLINNNDSATSTSTNGAAITAATAATSNENNAMSTDLPNVGQYPSTNAITAQKNANSKSNENFKPLSQGLQKKYAKGVQYNMKLVIRGECNTGKSALWARLQGNGFIEEYVPSDEIRVATINWSSKICEDVIVKVEVWDVVDKSRKKRRPINPSLKLANDINLVVNEVSLDAEFLDVYKSTSGVLFIYDVTKPWTWDYVEREIGKVPTHIPILIIGNQLDMGHHRKVSSDKCLAFIEQLDRGSMGSVIRYCETSMRNGFGLKYIYQFLNVPFLQLQRESLLQQLQINARDMDTTLEQIDSFYNSDENNYDLFIDNLANKRRTKQEALAGDVLAKAKPLEEAKRLHDEALQAAALAEQNQQTTAPTLNNIVQAIKKNTEPSATTVKPTPTTKQKPPVVAVQPILQKAPKLTTTPPVVEATNTDKNVNVDDHVETQTSNPLVASTVDDFIPDDNDYETFLVDDNHIYSRGTVEIQKNSSSNTKISVTGTTTDEEIEHAGNPMVKGFREHLDSDDDQSPPSIIQQESTIDYEPESPVVVPIQKPMKTVQILQEFSSADLDFLGGMSSANAHSTQHEPIGADTDSVTSDSVVTKPKKKKSGTKSKKTEVAASSLDATTKTKKKKKSSASKTIEKKAEPTDLLNENEDDDLESFLADVPTTTRRNGNDYEDI